MTETNIFRNQWWVVAASMLALVVGSGANIFSFSVFMKPIADDLGVGRGVIATAASMVSFIGAVASPFFGKMIDRWGVRPVLLPAVVLYAVAFACLSLLSSSIWMMFLLFGIVGLVSVGGTPAAYSKAVSSWFDKRRGLALGIALAGVGLGTAVVPELSSYFIGRFGWRGAYIGMGITILVIAFIPDLLFVRESTESRKQSKAQLATRPGLTFSEAITHSWRFWALTVTFLLVSIANNGTITHIVPLLTDRGVSVPEAVGALSGVGVAILVGRIASGYCVDKIFAPYVAAVFFLFPVIGMAILYNALHGSSPFIAAILLGLATGAEYDMTAFFISRYFGLKSFGALYGFIFGVSQIGNGIGVSLMGWTYQLMHSYHLGLVVAACLLIVACILILTLGPYAYKVGAAPMGGLPGANQPRAAV